MTGSTPLRVTFVARQLSIGGAERQLATLASGFDPARIKATVLTMYPGGEIYDELRRQRCIDVLPVGKCGRWDLIGFAARLVDACRATRPDVIYGWQTVTNELAWLCAKRLGLPVVWGIRASQFATGAYHWSLGPVLRVGARLTPFVDAVVCNSDAGRRAHEALGYAPARMHVIPNGIDTDRFVPDDTRRRETRSAWGVPADATLVGMVARIDPHKGIAQYLEAAAGLPERADLYVALVGPGRAEEREALRAAWGVGPLAGRLKLVEALPEAERIYPALDLLVSASWAEGFSNSIAEAMACGVPCVVTDVGDSAIVVGETGIVVPPRDVAALRDAIASALAWRDRPRLGGRARQRIVESFSVAQLVERSSALLEAVA
jgi:glycosyltransferase involved in cell wall biosynthesis